MDFSKLTLGDKIAGGCGLGLLITLLFLPWHQVCIDFGFGETCVSRGALESPNGSLGILALLVAVAVVGVLVLTRLTEVELPELPISWNQAIFYGAIATLALLFFKLISETEGLGFGSYLAIILGGGLTYGGFLIFKDDDGGDASAGGGEPQAF